MACNQIDKEKIDDLKESIQKHIDRVRRGQENAVELSSANQALKENNRTLNQQIEALNQQIEALNQQNREWQIKYKALSQKNQEWQNQYREQCQKAEKLEQWKKDREEKENITKNTLEYLRTQMDELHEFSEHAYRHNSTPAKPLKQNDNNHNMDNNNMNGNHINDGYIIIMNILEALSENSKMTINKERLKQLVSPEVFGSR